MAEFKNVSGFSELKAALEALPEKIQRNGLRRAVSKGAAEIRNEARSRAPVDTGEMRKDIQIKRRRTPDGKIATYEVYVRSGKRSRLAGKARNIHRDSFYWKFVEFGTSKMAAQPFMRPAFDEKKEDAAETIRETLREVIQDATR